MDFVTVQHGSIALNVAVEGDGPLIVCVHGFPELWYSWRHQIEYFAARGYRVAALDVRGYGRSSKPPEIAAYSIRNLADDVVAVIDQLGDGPAILFGHDWGAPIVWNTALLHPQKVRAVAGLSVRYSAPRSDASLIAILRQFYAGRFFYMLYFQKEGVAEAELEADVRTSLRKTFFSASGDAPRDRLIAPRPEDANFLDGMIDPETFPAWMSEEELRIYVDAFEAGGLRGPLNRYRAQDIDFADLAPLAGRPVVQPAYFVGGERDPVRHMIPGHDMYANPGEDCTDFRGAAIIPGAGHWVQQEAPGKTNAALEAFLSGL